MLNNMSILPHDDSIIVKDITKKTRYIQLMKKLLKEFQQALFFFENKELNYFDAQVGETLCQIRAYKIYLLSTKFNSPCLKSLLSLKKVLDKTIKNLESYESQYDQFLKQSKKDRPDHTFATISLADFFFTMECIFPLSEDALFIFLAFFLCKFHIVDNENIPIGINFNAVAKSLDLSSSYSKKLAQFYQKTLSELSCKFIFELLNELPNLNNFRSVLPSLHLKSDEGRMVLPCYPVTEIIILHMIKNNAKAVLLVDIQFEHHKEQIAFGFEGSHETHSFKLVPLLEESTTPCVVFYGGCVAKDLFFKEEIIDKLLSMGMKDIVLCNNAAHPQYSGATLSGFSIDPYQALIAEKREYLSSFEIEAAQNLSRQISPLKKLAEYKGCTIVNQSLFFLKHIFCDTMENHINSQMPISFFLTESAT